MPDELKVGVGVFMDYVNATGAGRIGIIKQQMERILDPTRLAWYPYTAAERALRKSVASADRDSVLRQAIESAPAQMRVHYEEIVTGWIRWLDRHPHSTLVPVSAAKWECGGLTVSVRHHLGLRQRDDRVLVALLYMKQQPLTQTGANVGLRILQQTIDDVRPGAEATVIDVRRSRMYRIRRNQQLGPLDDWIGSEAAGYLQHWNSRLGRAA